MKTTSLLLILFAFQLPFINYASAGFKDAMKSSRDGSHRSESESDLTDVICEHLLEGPVQTKALSVASKNLINRPFLIQNIQSDLKPLTLDLFGLREIQARGLQNNLVLTLFEPEDQKQILTYWLQTLYKGEIRNVSSRGLSSPSPTLQAFLSVKESELSLDYGSFIKKYHIPANPQPLLKDNISYATKTDESEIRNYVTAKYYQNDSTIVIEVGLDVRCENLDGFVTEDWDTYHHSYKIFTDSGVYCRIPVASFVRQSLYPEP